MAVLRALKCDRKRKVIFNNEVFNKENLFLSPENALCLHEYFIKPKINKDTQNE